MLLSMVYNVCYAAQYTSEEKAAAAKAPVSKLLGEWYGAQCAITFKKNGIGVIELMEPINSNFITYDCYLNFKYSKKGNKLTAIPYGKNDGFVSQAHGMTQYLTPKGRRQNQEKLDIAKTAMILLLALLNGDINCLDNYYLIVENNEFRSEKYYKDQEKIREAEKKEEAARKERERIELENWKDATNNNTIEAYETFIEKNPDSKYVSQAKNIIQEKKIDQEWDFIKDSEDIEIIEEFVEAYPKFKNISTAKNILNSLKGLKEYNNNDISAAMGYFKRITAEKDIPLNAKEAYLDVKQHIQFEQLSLDSTIEELNSYLNTFPNTPFKDQVNNYIAIKLSKAFNDYSTQSDYDKALSYATGDTYNKISEKIKVNQILVRDKQRRENGGWCGIVLEFLDASWNARVKNGLFEYKFGVKFKIGNFNDRVQFAIGAKPGVGAWDFKSVYVEKNKDKKNKASCFFDMPLEAELRLNLCKVDNLTWLFLDGRYDYNLCRKREIQKPMSFYVGLGFAADNVDITFLYGRQIGSISKEYEFLNGLPNPFMNSKNNNYIGISTSVYIRL